MEGFTPQDSLDLNEYRWPALLIDQLWRWVPLTPSVFDLSAKAAHRTQRNALVLQFIMEDITKDNKSHRQECVQGMEHHTFQEPACVQLSRRFNSSVLLTVYGNFIVQALMIKSLAIDLSAQPLPSIPSPEIQQWDGAESSNPLITCVFPWQPNHPQDMLRTPATSHLIRTRKTLSSLELFVRNLEGGRDGYCIVSHNWSVFSKFSYFIAYLITVHHVLSSRQHV